MCSGSSCKRTRQSSRQCLNPAQPIQTFGVEWPHRYFADKDVKGFGCFNEYRQILSDLKRSPLLLQGYYKRTPAYIPMRKAVRKGCFAVPMVHSTFLIDLRKEASRQLAFHPPHPEYSWAFDDIIVFAFSARMAGTIKISAWIKPQDPEWCNFILRTPFHPLLSTDVQMFVCNKETYGYLPVPLRSHNTLQDEADSFLHSLLEVNGEYHPLNIETGFTFASKSLFQSPWFLLYDPMTNFSISALWLENYQPWFLYIIYTISASIFPLNV